MKTLVLILLIAAVVIAVIAVITALTVDQIGHITPGGILAFAQLVLLFAIGFAIYDRAYSGGQ